MKKFISIFTFVFLCVFTNAQTSITDLIQKNKESIQLSDAEISSSYVSDAYPVKSANYSMVYLQQAYKEIPVYNQLKVLAFRDGKLISNYGTFIKNIEKATQAISAIPPIDARGAVNYAFSHLKLSNPTLYTLSQSGVNHKIFDFGKPSSVTENITSQLFWYPLSENNITTIHLVWEVKVAPTGTDDIWRIHVDATNGKIIDKNNMVIFEDFANDKHNKITSQSIHYTSNTPFKIDYQNKQVSNNLIYQSKDAKPNIVANANYNVIPYPYEAPSFTSATVKSNPWSVAGNAGTLGWHSDGTNDYNISRGNNVFASQDTLGTNSNTGTPATSSTSPNPLNFLTPPNYNVEPSRDAAMAQFCITNLFYWNNITHDITYQYGFDEPSGNFQVNNQSRGGVGNDNVKGLVQSGAAGHIGNNANFATPPDGGQGQMRMYLFNAVSSVTLHVNTPVVIAGNFVAVEGAFSTNNLLANVGPKTGQVVYYNDDASGTTHIACSGAPTNVLTGKIAMIDRGTCSFVIKVLAAQNAGAIAVIMVNNVAGAPIIMGGTDNTITIPAVMISQADGATFAAQLSNNLNVTLSGTAGQVLDGDLDAGVITHEFGHGVSNRLTGGPSNTSCLGNAEEGGEGWSDYFALMQTTNWATATTADGPNPRPVGTYVLGQTPSGAGIRNYPYSTNLSVNPLTYANMGTGTIGTEVHNIGEIWCVALWEMTWGIILQENSINTNFYNFSLTNTGGNSIAFKLVTEGMRLQPCSPGYIDARNAILTADYNLYAGRHQCAIWTAFAKRGMGYSANQGSSNSAIDQTPASDLPPAATITSQPTNVTVLAGSNATFNITSSTASNGAYILYNWQVSLDGGATWNNVVPSATTNSLTLTAVTIGMNGNRYRCIVSEGCNNTISTGAILTVNTPLPIITTQPISATVCAPNTAIFSLVATGNSLTYQWQVNTGSGFTNITNVSPYSGATTNTLTITPTSGLMNGYQYQCIITGTGSVTSNIVSLNINTTPTIITQPSSVNACASTSTSFCVTATGTNITYQWQQSTTGCTGTFTNITGAVNNCYSIATVNASQNGYAYQCIVSTSCGSITSNCATLTVTSSGISISAQPLSQTVCAGIAVSFPITATGPGLSYQWQLSTDGGTTYSNVPAVAPYTGVTTATLTISPSSTIMNGYMYRCLVTGTTCATPVATSGATLTVNGSPVITSQPLGTTVCATNNATFCVTATGVGLSYQWQVSATGCGGTFSNISGATSSCYTATSVTLGQSGSAYQCVVSGTCAPAVTTTCALLTVGTAVSITTQPANTSVCPSGSTSFTVGGSGTGLIYVWYFSTDGGLTYNTVPANSIYSGVTTATLNITGALPVMNGYLYRCAVSSTGCTVPTNSNAGMLTVYPTPTVNAVNNQTVCNGGSTAAVTFSGAVTGTVYNWTNNTTSIGLGASGTGNIGSFTATNATNAPVTATITVTPSVVNGSSTCTGATQSFTITVNPTPTVNAIASQTVCANTATTAVTFSGAVTGTVYNWTNSTTSIGLGASGTGNISSFTALNAGTTPVTATITVTPSYSNGGTTCTGATKSFTITVNPLPTITCPANIVVSNGAGLCGAVVNYPPATATGTPAPTITYSIASGSTFPVGVTTVTATATNACGVASCSFTVRVNDTQLPVITCPGNITVTTGGGACTSVVNYNVTASDNCAGVTTTLVSGPASGSSFPIGLTTVTWRATDASGNSSTCSFTVTVNDGAIPGISIQPVNVTTCVGNNATFTVTAVNAVSYQWQQWNGVAWVNIANSNSATYTVSNVTIANNTNAFRVIVNGSCNTATSNEAILFVNTLPNVSIATSMPPQLLPMQMLTLTAVAVPTGGNYVWYYNGVANGQTGSSIGGITVDNTGVYTVVYTDPNGCSNTSTGVNVTAKQSSYLYIYPVPNNGTFHVRFYNLPNENVGVQVYDAKGALVYNRYTKTTTSYGDIVINLNKEAQGTYEVKVVNQSGALIGYKRIIVER